MFHLRLSFIYKYLLTIFFLLFIVLLAILYISYKGDQLFIFSSHRIESFNKYTEVKTYFPDGSSSTLSGTNDDKSDMYHEGQELFFMCKDISCSAKYQFQNSTKIDKITILYTGYFPKDQDNILFRFDNDIVDKNLFRNCEEKSNICNYYFTKNKNKINNLDILLRNGTFKPYGINEIKFYQSSKKNIFESIFDFFLIWPRNLYSYLLYPLLFFLIFIIPGLLISQLLKIYQKEPDFLIVLSLTVIFWLLVSLSSFVLYTQVIKLIILLNLLLFIYYLFKETSFIKVFFVINKNILIIYLISLLAISLIMYVRDFPKNENTNVIYDFYYNITAKHVTVPFGSYESDFLIPYQTAVNFVRGGNALNEKIGMIYNITDRTPFFSLIFISFAKAFGMNLFMYQMFVVVLSPLFIIAVFYLALIWLSPLKSYLISFILAFSHFFIFMTIYEPVKNATLFFIFSSIFFLLKKQTFLSGILIALAYLFHPFALAYFIPILIYVFIKTFKKNALTTLIFSLPTFFASLSWSLFSLLINQSSRNIYLSVFTGMTWEQASREIYSNKPVTFSRLLEVIFKKQYWINKLDNLIGLFIFYTPKNYQQRIYDIYKTTIPGTIGIISSGFLLVGFIYSLFKKKFSILNQNLKKIIFYFVLVPLIFIIMYHGYFIRIGLMWFALGVIPFLLIILGMFFSDRIFKLLVFFIISESFILFFILDKNSRTHVINYLDKENLLPFFLLIVYLLIITFYFFVLRCIKNYGQRQA